jgi:autotransporter translocation and assembly factor TamB
VRRQAGKTGGGKIFLYIAGTVASLVLVGGVALSVLDIAGGMVADIAKKTVAEQTGMQLSVKEVHGNPIRGYTFSEIQLASAQNESLFSAKSLGAGVNFMSLLKGSPRLATLSIGGVEMDLDKFVTEFSKIKFSDSQGSGEVPIDRLTLKESRFTSKWGEIDVGDATARFSGPQMNIALDGAVNAVPVKGSLDLAMQGENITVHKADIGVGKGSLTSSGSLRPGPDGYAVDFQGTLKNIDVSEITAFWRDFLSSDDYSGAADVNFSLEGAGSSLMITASLAYRGSTLGGYPVENVSANLKYSDMRLTVSDLKATALGIPIDGSAAVAMKPGAVPSIMIQLEGSDAPLNELARLYPQLGKVEGKVDRFSARIQGPTNALSGTVELAAPEVVLMNRQITGLAAQVKLAQSDTATVSGKFVLEGAQGYLQGTAAHILTGAALDLTLKLLNLDIKKVEDLIPDGKKYGLSGALTADLAIKGKVSSPTVSGTVSSPKFSAMGYDLDKPSVTFAWDGSTLKLTDSGGTWSGLPIKVNGSVGPLSSKTPSIDMKAQLAFSPAALKQFVPDVAAWKLQGNISAGVKLTGKLPSPKVELTASSPALSAFDVVSAKNLEATTVLGGDLAKLDKMDLNLKAGVLAASGMGLQNLSATIKKDGQQIRLENASAKSGEGSITGGGTVTLAADAKNTDAKLDLAFDLTRLDLAPLAKSGGLSVPLSGILSGKASVKGTSSNPSIAFTAQVPNIAASGLTATDLAADVSGNLSALKINSFKANLGGAPLSATGTVVLSGPFRADLDISGTGLDLAALTAGLPDMKGAFSGKADLNFSVKSGAQGNSGTGSVRSAAVTAYGLKLSDLNIPLALSGNSLKSENGTLNFYGGKVKNSLTFDMNAMKFSDSVTAEGFDVNAAAQDATGGLGGKITGKGVLSLKIDGSAAKNLTYSGSGQFTMGEGSISGFSGLDVLTRLYGVNGIRYTKVTAPLRIETGRLIVAKGSSAVPPAKDPIYRSAALTEDGAFTFDKKLYFVAAGNVNFQLVNALAGGAAGGAEALLKGGGSLQDVFSGKNLESALKGALGAAKESSQESDFRDVSVKVTGTADKPSVALLKVGPSSQQQDQSAASKPAQTQTPASAQGTSSAPAAPAAPKAPSAPAKPEEVLKEAILDAIAPQTKETKETKKESGTTEGQPQPDPKQQQQQKIEKEIQKGIEGLFKKKK